LIFSVAIVYVSLGSIFPFFAPFIGIVYMLWADAVRKKEHIFIFFCIFYTVILESIWGLPIYSILIAMIVMIVAIEPKIYHLLHPSLSTKLIRVAIFDILYFTLIEGYEILMEKSIISKSFVLIYYLLIDLVGVILL